MKLFFALMLMFSSAVAVAGELTVLSKTYDGSMEEVYPKLYEALENKRLFVVFEPNIGASLSGLKQRLGDEYNSNQLTSIRSMVFCNGWYANKVSNLDPQMLALCPMRIGLYEKDGKTTALFARPTVIGKHSPALQVLKDLEADVLAAMNAVN